MSKKVVAEEIVAECVTVAVMSCDAVKSECGIPYIKVCLPLGLMFILLTLSASEASPL
jgi:hypothetical protein